MNHEVAKMYGNRVRARVCGLCWKDDSLLMVNHSGLNNSDFWAPPGGGIEFGQTIHACLVGEFQEETGLKIIVKNFVFGCEFIHHPLHSIELFYNVEVMSGELKIGGDPELQIIQDVQYLTFLQLKNLPPDQVHGVFSRVASASELQGLTGFFSI
jgi:8-oxo-dGTP diphosphatase